MELRFTLAFVRSLSEKPYHKRDQN